MYLYRLGFLHCIGSPNVIHIYLTETNKNAFVAVMLRNWKYFIELTDRSIKSEFHETK